MQYFPFRVINNDISIIKFAAKRIHRNEKTATLALLLTTAVGAWAQTNPSHDAINLEEVW